MGEHQLEREESLRIAAPNVYRRMVETFEKHNIHPYDAQGSVIKKKEGLDVTLRLSNSFSEVAKTHISFEQVKEPDTELTDFFEQAAEKCKKQLITDYYKMIKL
ncbi:hypothetical protein ACFYKT_14325 [Cytobacillus sp. FJAT-53684]|uniref:Uncharacterized protein n=1 Tax=Cytobacillus mangrovibacter TaxID=3299024 RepID=A0ABW6K099_9BACI